MRVTGVRLELLQGRIHLRASGAFAAFTRGVVVVLGAWARLAGRVVADRALALALDARRAVRVRVSNAVLAVFLRVAWLLALDLEQACCLSQQHARTINNIA